jgi:uncharacterized membrane protein
MPNASSQQFTTSTWFSTSTLTQTGTSYSASYYSVNSTAATTWIITAYINNRVGSCYLRWMFFNSTGMPLHVDYSTSQPMVLYILNFFDWGLWALNSGAGFTDPCHPTLVVYQASISSSGSFGVNLPTSGNSYALLLVATQFINPTITLTIGPTMVVFAATATTAIPIASTTTGTITLTFYTTLQVPFIQTYGSWIVAGILAILVIVALIVALKKRKRAEKRYCINCGAEIGPPYNFCGKCGTQQT